MATPVLVLSTALSQKPEEILVHKINNTRRIYRIEVTVVHLLRGSSLPFRVLLMVSSGPLSVEGGVAALSG